MTEFRPTMAEAQAMGLCYLARQRGLPNIYSVRAAVAQLHPLSCGWCDYPIQEIVHILRQFNAERDEDKDHVDDRLWARLSSRQKREAIATAQGNAE